LHGRIVSHEKNHILHGSSNHNAKSHAGNAASDRIAPRTILLMLHKNTRTDRPSKDESSLDGAQNANAGARHKISLGNTANTRIQSVLQNMVGFI
jgi:hypothetical protein